MQVVSTMTQIWKETVSSRWIKKLWSMIMEYSESIRKNETMMELQDIWLSKVSQWGKVQPTRLDILKMVEREGSDTKYGSMTISSWNMKPQIMTVPDSVFPVSSLESIGNCRVHFWETVFQIFFRIHCTSADFKYDSRGGCLWLRTMWEQV